MAHLRFPAALLAAAAVSIPASADTFVYVHDRGALNQVHAFSLAKNGDLTPVPGTPFPSSDPIANGKKTTTPHTKIHVTTVIAPSFRTSPRESTTYAE